MSKLIILPGTTNVLGGTLVTLSLLIKGCELLGKADQLCVLTRSGSFMEEYLCQAGQGEYLQIIEASNDAEFVQRSLQWLQQQPREYPVLLDNCVGRRLMSVLVPVAPRLGLSKRHIYFFFHDLALSYNYLGYLVRKFIFTCLSPVALCNSKFTAGHIQRFVKDVRGILYQPVDIDKYNDRPFPSSPPQELQKIIDSGKRLMLTPSRLNKPGIVNDKNLRALIPVLAELNKMGCAYHGVVIGEDHSSDGSHTRQLIEAAETAGVADCFTILPPTQEIETYYKCADVVVSLAPREPFGRIVVEAIACGVPVIGSCTGGIGEILHNFAPEWTVDPANPIEVAKTIIRLSKETEKTTQLLNQGKEWVRQECSLTNYASHILSITGMMSTNDMVSEPKRSTLTT